MRWSSRSMRWSGWTAGALRPEDSAAPTASPSRGGRGRPGRSPGRPGGPPPWAELLQRDAEDADGAPLLGAFSLQLRRAPAVPVVNHELERRRFE